MQEGVRRLGNKRTLYRSSRCLIVFGALLLCDSRVAESDNNAFLDLFEGYLPNQMIYSRKMKDQKLVAKSGSHSRTQKSSTAQPPSLTSRSSRSWHSGKTARYFCSQSRPKMQIFLKDEDVREAALRNAISCAEYAECRT
ncbi:hypothetical protein E1B28_001437 [Marasmius oreades]|uniref:Secreted protein n=1 Tax=Marasmius oreades TaxID=181124 RepID=A0A9P7V3E0_9AGAR|nr:uncharacterized protein E1B28_001437 [Marasmius oreades]KAG7099609.1 hypothetical protein E1B28_001437 [Marasmius oreades]